jgi:hypothetical protein
MGFIFKHKIINLIAAEIEPYSANVFLYVHTTTVQQ